MKLQFLGAAGTVTGSRTLIEADGARLLVDCGLFQGLKDLRQRNWVRLPVDPASIDAVVLTHAHLDHSGWLPRLVKQGFTGRVYCTAATHELARLLLLDCGYLMEEDAAYANRKGFSKHHPALPLYTQDDAEQSLHHFEDVAWDEPRMLPGGLELTLLPAGHILGASMVRLGDGRSTVLFTGDLGRPVDLVMRPPREVRRADYLVLESTYGDRLHSDEDPVEQLGAVVRRTAERGGVLLIPAFAVGRSQALLRALQLLKERRTIPDLHVALDSPMAVNATELYVRYASEHRLTEREANELWSEVELVRTADQSKALNRRRGPHIVVSAAGMLTGGRVLHHLKNLVGRQENTLLFSGFQAAGTRGANILAGAREVRVHGRDLPIACEVARIDALSAHADQQEILQWLGGFERPPVTTFLNHGEPRASVALREEIQAIGWECRVAGDGDRVALKGP